MEQDARFYNNEKKLLKRLKYPPNIGTKVNRDLVYQPLLPELG